MVKRQLLAGVLVLTTLAAGGRAQQGPAPLRLVQSIPMPAGFVHFDHFGVDAKGGRLFATFEDHNTVEVLYLQELNEVVITDGAGTVSMLRGDTLQTIHTVKLARNADFVVYDAKTQLFYVTNGGHAANMTYALVSVIDLNGKHVGDIRVDGVHIEFLTGEKSGPRLFVNVADKHEVAVIDREKREVTSLWPLPDAEENLPLAVDEDRRRVFVVSRKPPAMFVLDGASGKVITSLPSVGDSDDMAYDARNRRIYVSGGEGYVSVFEQDDADHYTVLGKVPSGPGGSTSV